MERVNDADFYADFEKLWLDKDISKFEMQTSGSTGQPKRIYLSRKMMQKSAGRTIDYFALDSDWLLVSCISGRFVGGRMMVVRAHELNARFQCVAPSNRPDLTVAKEWPGKVLVAVVPSQMWHILSDSFSPSQLEKIHFLVGGSALPPKLREEMVKKGIRAWETYGMTETASHIALRPITLEPAPFRPLAGIRISSTDSGTLRIDLPYSDPIITNDLVKIFQNGDFNILGRADNVIVTGGLKVIPEALENRLRLILEASTFKIGELMVTSIPDSKWGEALTLMIEVNEDETRKEGIVEEIESLLRLEMTSNSPRILRHEMPKRIILTDSLPRTENGKLRRKP